MHLGAKAAAASEPWRQCRSVGVRLLCLVSGSVSTGVAVCRLAKQCVDWRGSVSTVKLTCSCHLASQGSVLASGTSAAQRSGVWVQGVCTSTRAGYCYVITAQGTLVSPHCLVWHSRQVYCTYSSHTAAAGFVSDSSSRRSTRALLNRCSNAAACGGSAGSRGLLWLQVQSLATAQGMPASAHAEASAV